MGYASAVDRHWQMVSTQHHIIDTHHQ